METARASTMERAGVRFPAGLLPPRSSRAPASAEQPVEWCQSFGRVRERPSVSEESDGVATGRPAALLERDGIERADVAGQVGLEWLDQLLMRSIRSSTHSFHAVCLPARSKMRPVDARIRCGVRHDGLVVHTDDEGCGRARAPVALPAQPGRTPARTKLEGMRSQWSAFASIIAVDGTISFENENRLGDVGEDILCRKRARSFTELLFSEIDAAATWRMVDADWTFAAKARLSAADTLGVERSREAQGFVTNGARAWGMACPPGGGVADMPGSGHADDSASPNSVNVSHSVRDLGPIGFLLDFVPTPVNRPLMARGPPVNNSRRFPMKIVLA